MPKRIPEEINEKISEEMLGKIPREILGENPERFLDLLRNLAIIHEITLKAFPREMPQESR